jgi:MSHA biogenesis protein MshM
MYYAHFGLNQAPFRITPNTEFFFGGGNRGAILEALIYAVVSGEGIVKVTGEVGSGKTMLCSMLQARLPPHIETVYLAHPSVAPDEILHAIAFELQLGLERSAPRLEVMHRLHEHLLRRHAEGRRVVAFVEESQSMPLATLEEIRLLSNLETKNDKLLQIVLFGQPELDDNLAAPGIRQLRERITHSFRLEPLDAAAIHEYLMFRLRAAGYRGPDLFSAAVVKRIARASGGLTRRVNVIADKALLAAFSENTHTVRTRHIDAAVRDSEFGRHAARAWLAPRYGWAAGLVLAGAAAGAALYALVQPAGNSPPSREVAPAARAAGAAVPAAASAEGRGAAETAAAATVSAPAAAQDAQSGHAAQPAGPATKAAAPAEPQDLVTARLAATREWLAIAADTTYSIQLMGTDNEELLKHHLNDVAKFVEINKVFLYRTVVNRKPSLNVLYGAFSDRREAQEALDRLPPALHANRPFLRTVGGVRAEIRRQQHGA